MNYSEVQELLKAGFTADEIRTMLNSQNPQNNPQPDPEPTDPAPAADPAPDPEPTEPKEDPRFEQLNDTMTKILKAIQGQNLQRNSYDHPVEADINKEVDKIMGSLIRPEHEKGD